MHRVVLAILALFSVGILTAQPLTFTQLTCENSVNPIGIEVKEPRFSWKIGSVQRNTFQTAYQVMVADDPASLASGKGTAWD